jgi:2-C-methyl-D-erythritol 4-phosphate cytidylyltransferase/2-C-methyl-D-erythritol 2,4-cyclodiphosphate synthase
MAHIGTILVAAGSSVRIGGGVPKQFRMLGLRPMFIRAMDSVLGVSEEIVVVVPPEHTSTALEHLRRAGCPGEARFEGKRIVVVPGGARRQDSVRRGLTELSSSVDLVLVHDAARPFASAELVQRVVAAAEETGAAVPVVQIPDTLKLVKEGAVVETVDRLEHRLSQTPQGFLRAVIEEAYRALRDADVTDDAQAAERMRFRVAAVAGEAGNRKITTVDDLESATARANREIGLDALSRVGTGSDTHLLVPDRRLVLGGVEVPFERGLDGHSDADVAVHAICDAVLGAASAGDIGRHFPPGDPRFKDISSLVLLERTREIVRKMGFEVGNVDVTIIAEKPRLAPHVPAMLDALARALGVPTTDVSVKATTTEGAGPEGEGLAISATAVALLRKLI